MTAVLIIMGTSATENREINYQLPIDRPKVYPCTACGDGYEFTKLGLEVHRKYCSHQETCLCLPCRYKYKSSPEQSIQSLSEQTPQSLHVQSKSVAEIYIENILDSAKKKVKLSKVIETENTKNDLGSIVEKPVFATKSLPIAYSEGKNREGKSESSDSWEDSHSDDSQRNQNKRLLYLKPISIEDSKSKLLKGKPLENYDNLESNHDGEPCNRKIFCIICDKHIFWESFGTHVLQHSIKIENSHLVCPQCNQAYRSPNLYLMHFPCHLVNHDCHDCHCDHPKCFKRSAVPLPEHSYAGDSTCFICLKTLNGNPSIVTHLKIHCKECPFTCEECNRSFRQTGNLQRHMLAHRGEKPHKCSSCGTGFSDPATLRNHVRTHTKETPFVCKVCKRGFSQVGNLKRHMALHVMKEMDAPMLFINGGENEKSIGIFAEKIGPDDEKSSGSDLFSDSEAQKIDNTSVNDEFGSRTRKRGRNGQFKLHVCKLCGKKYAWRHDLNIHFRTHTGEKPYKCDKCDKKFAQSGAVRMHHARHHSKPKLSAKKMPPKLKVITSIST